MAGGRGRGRGRGIKLTKSPPSIMQLRSGQIRSGVAIEQEASSRVVARSPLQKKRRLPHRCIFVDDEALEGDSNDVHNVVEGEDIANVVHDETLEEGVSNDVHDGFQTENLANVEETTKDVAQDGDATNDDVDKEERMKRHGLGEKVPMGLMSEVLSKFYVNRPSKPPLVPLCRLVPNESVRMASEDASWLIPLFDDNAYMENMGIFLVSLRDSHGALIPISNEVQNSWDPIWQEKSSSFDMECNRDWSDLCGNRFLVWDGNHRLKTWTKRIKERFQDSVPHHVCVRCVFIEVEAKKEAELLLALDTTNIITRAHAIPNLGHEIFMFQKFGIANKESILQRLSPDQKKWAISESQYETRHYGGIRPWYDSPCILISQLVWKDEFNRNIANEESRLRSKGFEGHDLQLKLHTATKEVEERMRDKGYKYLCIANPSHGEAFFNILFSLKWNDKTMINITRDKLHSLCSANISVERRREILHVMSLSKAKDPNAAHFADYKSFRFYMRKEAYWAHINSEAWLLIKKLEIEGPALPTNFESYYKNQRRLHVLHAYSVLLGDVKSANDAEKVPELSQSTKRFVYRWLHDCFVQKILVAFPEEIDEWKSLDDENSMFSPSLKERRITHWECEMCPWWLDYPLGVIPKQESELRKSFEKTCQITHPTNVEEREVAQAIEKKSSRKKNKEKEKFREQTSTHEISLVIENENEKESEEAPLIRKKGKKGTKSMHTTTSTSIVPDSIKDQPSSLERRCTKRVTGPQFGTFVDALWIDVAAIDDFARDSIKEWFETLVVTLLRPVYHHHGLLSKSVARLIFADFPTSMLVYGIHDVSSEGLFHEVPTWNIFNTPLVRGVMDIAEKHLADEGFLVTLCLAQDLGKLLKYAGKCDLQMHRSWTLVCDGGYIHPQTREQVNDLTIGLFYRKTVCVPNYDRAAGEEISSLMFPANQSCITEAHARSDIDLTRVDGKLIRGGAERSIDFFSWLLATFTQEDDYVVDVLSGCGGLGAACAQEMRHCLLLESDFYVFSECLQKKVCGPSPDDV